MRDGAQILRDLDDACRSVQSKSADLDRGLKKFGEAHVDDAGQLIQGTKLRYEVAIDEELIRIHEEAIQEGRRAPAEDIRGALARRAVRTKQPELVAEYEQQKTWINALKLSISNSKAVISGYQSLRRGEAT
jgi:hypothetical protein